MANRKKQTHRTAGEIAASVPTDRRVERLRSHGPKGGPYTSAVAEHIRDALRIAHLDGYTRAHVADMLGVSTSLIGKWIDPETDNRPHAGVVVRMVADTAVLGESGAEVLGRAIVELMGLSLDRVVATDDTKPVPDQVMDVTQWMGELAVRVRDAGEALDSQERSDITEAARQVQVEAQQLIDSLGGEA